MWNFFRNIKTILNLQPFRLKYILFFILLNFNINFKYNISFSESNTFEITVISTSEKEKIETLFPSRVKVSCFWCIFPRVFKMKKSSSLTRLMTHFLRQSQRLLCAALSLGHGRNYGFQDVCHTNYPMNEMTRGGLRISKIWYVSLCETFALYWWKINDGCTDDDDELFTCYFLS